MSSVWDFKSKLRESIRTRVYGKVAKCVGFEVLGSVYNKVRGPVMREIGVRVFQQARDQVWDSME